MRFEKTISIGNGLRKTGFEFINDVSWGSHLSLFYDNKKDLLDVLAAYFKLGLENDEFCMWVTSFLTVEEALEAMRSIMPDFDTHLNRGQIEIVPHTRWYLEDGGGLNLNKVLKGWVNKLNQALANGYEGMRITGDTFWLEKKDWQSLNMYEHEINKVFHKHRIIAICTYNINRCSLSEIINICRNHQFAIILSGNTLDRLSSRDFSNDYHDGLNGLVVIETKEIRKIKEDMLRFDRLNLIGEMAASIGHEIRNPLTTIRGYLQLFKGKNVNREFSEGFDLMIEELDRANLIISEYLNLANNKSVCLKIRALNPIIRSLYPLIQANALISDKNVELELGDIPNFLLDDKEIRQLVLNLAQNGLDAMAAGGTLSIKTFLEGNKVVLAIQDQGNGIEPGLLEKICNPFFTTKENGTGLGLAVCLSIANRHNAVITVETSHKGTTFYVRFKMPDFKLLNGKTYGLSTA